MIKNAISEDETKICNLRVFSLIITMSTIWQAVLFFILRTLIFFIIIINFYVKHLQTSREEYSEMEHVVRRRYNDFVWLRQKLIDAFPTHVVPVSILQPRLNYI